jgi:outer membrane lipoprotein-sorting protein
MMRGSWQVALAVCAAALLGGCSAKPPAAPPRPGVAGADQARAVVERRAAESRTLTATFSIEMRRKDGAAEKSHGAVVVVRPDRLRLQIFSFGVMTAYDFTVAGERYHVRRPLEGIDMVGRFGDAGSRTAIDLGEDLRPLFLAGPLSGARIEDAGDRFRVIAGEPSGRREIDVDKRDGRIAAERLFTKDEPRITIEYGDYRTVDGLEMPFSIHVHYLQKAVEVAISVSKYTRNQAVDPKLFEF